MTTISTRVIALTEYVPLCLLTNELPVQLGESLWRTYGAQVAVDFPTPKTEGKWQLTSQGWVGHIPVSTELRLVLLPKVELGNLFRMLEYAYRLKSFRFLDGMISCQSLEEFYERLANILALRVLDRSRKGFYRAYLNEEDKLPFIRGRLDMQAMLRSPLAINPYCHYQEHSADVEENQILAWTLYVIARSGVCTERVLPTVRKAYRALQGSVSLMPFRPQSCVDRLYIRLNDDYHPLHALCRFFLERSGPSHQTGDHKMLPFLVDMASLFELFVAEWLKEQLPPELTIKVQEPISIDQNNGVHFEVDLVLYDAHNQKPLCILDTKYKRPSAPSTDDIAQVVAYAEAKKCKDAVLIYPTALSMPLDARIGDIRVRSLTFSLDGDLEQAGRSFLGGLTNLRTEEGSHG